MFFFGNGHTVRKHVHSFGWLTHPGKHGSHLESDTRITTRD